ncbi:two-component sensor histidine kinase [Xylophilus rhododendri]|uniref:histidine kinase n=1 Tax=Xylophilus rhododendri TaxID=2697032 RepID=A0A857J926_9BURK|nr:ATP-binding protein [Xylophilus rhododendri]QHJ00541.1 two-component sensor histidine kinase [Xylophilus rhododendri]
MNLHLPAPRSLQDRLMVLLLACVVLAAAALAMGAYRNALQEADAINDLHLQQVANSLRHTVPLGGMAGEGDDGDLDLQVQIWGSDGVQLYRSARSGLPQRAVLGFSDMTVEGTRYRVYSIQTPLQTVQIAQDMDARQERARAQALRATLPVVLVAPVLMLAMGAIISRTLAPVERMRRQVAGRAADDLRPLPEDHLPDEVLPLVQELNLLFGRVRGAFDAQRQFVADAAHELRSPLTALKLQVQGLQRGPTDAAAQEAATARLAQGIDRAIALVGQLLQLARQDAGEGAASPAVRIDLRDVVQTVVADALPLAAARQIDLGVVASDSAPLTGHAESLQTLLRNLLDNAIKFAPPGGRIDVELRQSAGEVLLAVDDNGPGIAQEFRARVLDRFFRAPDAQAPGSGLGLAIVRAVAERHGGRLALLASPTLGGLRVELRLPGA